MYSTDSDAPLDDLHQSFSLRMLMEGDKMW